MKNHCFYLGFNNFYMGFRHIKIFYTGPNNLSLWATLMGLNNISLLLSGPFIWA